MNRDDISILANLLKANTEIIFKDDFFEGNVLSIEEDFAIYMDFTSEIEREIYLPDFNEYNFTIGE